MSNRRLNWDVKSSKLVMQSHSTPSRTNCRRYTFVTPNNQLIYGELEYLFANAYIITYFANLPAISGNDNHHLFIYSCCLFIDKRASPFDHLCTPQIYWIWLYVKCSVYLDYRQGKWSFIAHI